MILRLLKNIPSMLASPLRADGRGWLTELLVRTMRDLFLEADQRGIAWLRQQLNKSPYHPAYSKVSLSSRELAGVPCMLLSPKQGASSDHVVVYFHGGGYVMGSPASHKSILAQIALDTKGLVIAPQYRLAPEHPFPAPQDDCLTVARLALKTYEDKKISLVGDSAGGALAIATARSLVEEGKLEKIHSLALLSPWVEPTAVEGSIKKNEKYDYLVAAFLGDSFTALIGEGDCFDERVNFLNANLSALPRTLVQMGGKELFVDQIQDFCDRAKQAGSDLELKQYPAQPHVFQLFSAILSDAKIAMNDLSSFIRSS